MIVANERGALEHGSHEIPQVEYVESLGSKKHMDTAHHVLRYVRATYNQAIVYERSTVLANTIVWGGIDSNWAQSSIKHRLCPQLRGGAVSWKSRQDCVLLFYPRSHIRNCQPMRTRGRLPSGNFWVPFFRTHLIVADDLACSLPAPAHVKHREGMTGRNPFCARTLRPATCVVGG